MRPKARVEAPATGVADSAGALVAAAWNSGWLFADRLLRLAVGLVLGVLIARQLGPHDFGSLSYATAFVSLFTALAALGLDPVVVRELATTPDSRHSVLGTALILKLVGALLAYAGVLIAIAHMPKIDPATGILVAIVGSGLVLHVLDALDLWFQAQSRSRSTVIARGIAFVVASALKVSFLLSDAGLLAFAWASVCELALGALALVVAYRVAGERLHALRPTCILARRLLHESWPLAISGLLVLVTMQADRILLGHLASVREVGVYGVAGQFSMVWYMVPMIVGTSIAPALARARLSDAAVYAAILRRVYTLMTVVSVAVACMVSLLATPLIDLLFGHAYAGAAPVLALHVWGAVFVFHVSIRTRALVVEHRQRLVTAMAAMTCLVSIALNLVLIPRFGALGAAYASVIAWSCCAVVFPLGWSDTRKSVVMFLTPFKR